MAIFKEAKQHTDREVVAKLLTTLAENPETTHRSLATEMGISLGMMVSCMKSCVKKGYVRAKKVTPRRWAYFVTPKGLVEKSCMVSSYLCNSLTFFRKTRSQLEHLFLECINSGIKNIAMVGESDVAEVALLVSNGLEINLKTLDSDEIYYLLFKNKTTKYTKNLSNKITNEISDKKNYEKNNSKVNETLKISQFDAFLITDIKNPQGLFDALKNKIDESKLLTIPALCIVRNSVKAIN